MAYPPPTKIAGKFVRVHVSYRTFSHGWAVRPSETLENIQEAIAKLTDLQPESLRWGD
jgi:hypothetical protein